jgi:hypothetical protein
MTDLEGGDDDVGRVDTDGNGSGVGLFNVNSVDVDDPFLSVDLDISKGEGVVDPKIRTWVTFPSLPLYFPRTIRTSSSFLTGMDLAYRSATV